MQLRDYQNDLISRTRAALRAVRFVLMQAPTGAGKTAISSDIFTGLVAKNNTAFFIVHRRQLIKQVSLVLAKADLPFGFIASGYKEDLSKPIQICMMQTLLRRMKKIKFSPKLLIQDECHLNPSSYKKIFDYYPEAKGVGLTATPRRFDGKGLDHIFERLIECEHQIKGLIELGYLAPFKYYAPNPLTFADINIVRGDYDKEQVGKRINNSEIVANAITQYEKLGNNGRFLNFSYSVAHSQQVATAFTEAGYICVHIDGETSDEIREKAFDDLAKGIIRGISNCNIAAEGVDIPAVEVLIMQSPTMSLSRFLQMIGRILRPVEGKIAIVIDHVSNVHIHGLPNEKREWTLKGKLKKAKEDKISAAKTCAECYAVCSISHSNCPECGAGFPVKSRDITETDGELTEIKEADIKNIRKREEMLCESLEDWKALARKRGHKSGWGWYRWQARQKSKYSTQSN